MRAVRNTTVADVFHRLIESDRKIPKVELEPSYVFGPRDYTSGLTGNLCSLLGLNVIHVSDVLP